MISAMRARVKPLKQLLCCHPMSPMVTMGSNCVQSPLEHPKLRTRMLLGNKVSTFVCCWKRVLTRLS